MNGKIFLDTNIFMSNFYTYSGLRTAARWTLWFQVVGLILSSGHYHPIEIPIKQNTNQTIASRSEAISNPHHHSDSCPICQFLRIQAVSVEYPESETCDFSQEFHILYKSQFFSHYTPAPNAIRGSPQT